jgi:calcineurin-like phosphoesterase
VPATEETILRILFIGDVVGRVGREAIRIHLPGCLSQWKIDLCVVNGENAADQGFGITQPIFKELLAAGADAVTLGNPSRNRREAFQFIDDAPHLIRPINYLSGTPGRGAALIETKTGGRALVINALGRLFMEPVEDPFGRIGVELDASPLGRGADAIRHRLPLRACAPGDRKI